MKTIIILILFSSPCFSQVVIYNGKAGFTIEKINTVYWFDRDTMAPLDTTYTDSIRHQIFRRVAGSVDSSFVVELAPGDSSALIENFPLGIWDIGYRGIIDGAVPSIILWSLPGWFLTVKEKESIIKIVKNGTFIGFGFKNN